MTGSSLNIVLAGGGTGGHVIPAIAVAEEVARRGGQAFFVGTRDRLEAKLVPAAGFDIDFIHVRPLAGGGIKQVVLGLASVPDALFQSVRLLKKIGADVVLGVGGYVAGPVVLAARLIGVKAALLEQNATVGLTNKLLTRVVNRAFVSYAETVNAFPPGTAVVTGNPVKKSILDAAQAKRSDRPGDPVQVLVMGGSQGALAIDERVPAAMREAGLGGQVSVTHQSTPAQLAEVRARYESAGIQAAVVPFIDDMAAIYRETDLVVARSGATTVSELTVMGLPAILLPYPHHADRQQTRNAEPMRQCGAAVVLDEKLTGTAEMSAALGRFIRDENYRIDAGLASAALGRPDAATAIADGIEALAGGDR